MPPSDERREAAIERMAKAMVVREAVAQSRTLEEAEDRWDNVRDDFREPYRLNAAAAYEAALREERERGSELVADIMQLAIRAAEARLDELHVPVYAAPDVPHTLAERIDLLVEQMTPGRAALGGEAEGSWRAVANDFQRAMFDREAVIEQMKEALEFLRCCEASGEAGADHPVVLHALGAANTLKPKPAPTEHPETGEREGKTDLPAHIAEVQEEVRDKGMCGAVFDSPRGEAMCIRDPGHPPPHGEAPEPLQDGGEREAWSFARDDAQAAIRAVLKASVRVRGGTMNWLKGAPTHVLAELLTELDKDGWHLFRHPHRDVEREDDKRAITDLRRSSLEERERAEAAEQEVERLRAEHPTPEASELHVDRLIHDPLSAEPPRLLERVPPDSPKIGGQEREGWGTYVSISEPHTMAECPFGPFVTTPEAFSRAGRRRGSSAIETAREREGGDAQ